MAASSTLTKTLIATCCAVIFTAPRVTWAEPKPAPGSSSSVKIPLPPIPPSHSDELSQPDKQASAELERLLQLLYSVKPQEQRKGAEALAEQDTSILPAIAAKLASLRKTADREGMQRILGVARKAAHEDEKAKGKPRRRPRRKVPFSDADKPHKRLPLLAVDQTDWLRYVLRDPSPKQQGYRDLVAVLALSRACASLHTTASATEIIHVYMYFGDMFRIDVQRQLERMGERALPALIAAQYHDSRMVRTWAKRQLDLLGKAIPSEAVRLSDPEALAGVLRAYGRAREVGAVRVIVSFCNSDMRQVRLAAREAIGQIRAPARWQLRDAYKRLMGTTPPRKWDWRRTARELFAVYDRARLQPVYESMAKGLALAKQEKFEQAAKQFDMVLARVPMFTRRVEMVPTYLALGKVQKDPDAAKATLRRAIMLDPKGPHASEAASQLAVLEARELRKRGIIDTPLLERAVTLDPDNDDAKAMLGEARNQEQGSGGPWRRYAAALAIGVLALAAMLGLALYPRRPKDNNQPKPSRPLPDAPPPN